VGIRINGPDYFRIGRTLSLFIIRLPMKDTNSPAGFKIVGRRLDLSSRHSPDQIKEMIQGKVFQHLFLQELLVETLRPARFCHNILTMADITNQQDQYVCQTSLLNALSDSRGDRL